MDHSQDLIRYYLQGIRHVTKATSATLYVPAPSTVSAHTLLVHEGGEGVRVEAGGCGLPGVLPQAEEAVPGRARGRPAGGWARRDCEERLGRPRDLAHGA